MKLTEKQFNILQTILLGYPLVLILIPRIFGFVLYSPLNSILLVVIVWIMVGGILLTVKTKRAIRLFIILTIISIGPFTLFGLGNEVGVNLEFKPADQREREREKILERFPGIHGVKSETCDIDIYVEDSIGGGGFQPWDTSSGGGSYVDSSIPFYKRKYSKLENCKPVF